MPIIIPRRQACSRQHDVFENFLLQRIKQLCHKIIMVKDLMQNIVVLLNLLVLTGKEAVFV